MTKGILVLLFCILIPEFVTGQNYVDYYNTGISHFNKAEYKDFVEALSKADSLRPNHPTITYNLAIGYAKLNKFEKAFHVLKKRMGYSAGETFLEDEEFLGLRETEYFNQLERYYLEQNETHEKSNIAFQIDKKGFHPEGIDYDEESERFYITDIHQGLIVSFSKDGNEKEIVSNVFEQGFWGLFGIKTDKIDNSIVWVTSSAVPEFKHYQESDKGRSVLLKISKKTGKVLRSYEVSGGQPHLFGDLLVTDNGDVYVTDSIQPHIYKLNRTTNTFDLFISNDLVWNLQGIAISKDNSHLIISDYILGLLRVNIDSKKITMLLGDINHKTRGSDGIYLIDERLFLIQNGTSPVRVSYLTLNNDGSATNKEVHIVDQNVNEMTDPTLGVVIDSEFYFIGNSPWQYYKNEKPLYEKWPLLNIYKLVIDEV